MSSIQQSTPQVGTSFVSLPREIRDLIYRTLLQIPNNPPASPEEAGSVFRDWSLHNSVEKYCEATWAGLPRCNWQIHDEFREVLLAQKPDREPGDFRLDCMIEEGKVWVTWVTVPPPGTREIGVWNLDFRLFETDLSMIFSICRRCFPRPLFTGHHPLGLETCLSEPKWKGGSRPSQSSYSRIHKRQLT